MTSVVPADLDAVIERKVQGTVFNQSANVTISLVGGRRGQEVVGAFCDWQIVGAQVMDTGRLMPNGELWSSFYTEGDRFAATCTMGNGARTFEVDVDTLMRF